MAAVHAPISIKDLCSGQMAGVDEALVRQITNCVVALKKTHRLYFILQYRLVSEGEGSNENTTRVMTWFRKI